MAPSAAVADAEALRVLVAAGDLLALDHTAATLERSGFRVLRATNGPAAVKRWQEERPDVVLVDVLLPPQDGFDLCRRIRENSRTPVFMIATDAVESEVVQGFTSGADDFVVRPFGTTQLAWRIRAVHGRYAAPITVTRRPHRIHIGDLTLDAESHLVQYQGNHAFLTPTEYRIFSALAAQQGTVVSVSLLMDAAWPGRSDHLVNADTLKSHITRLRRKLRDLGGQPRDIGVATGIGYALSWSTNPS